MQPTDPAHLIDLRAQVATLERLAFNALKDAGYDTREATYQALLAGMQALQRELHHEERGAALLHSLQATAEQTEAA